MCNYTPFQECLVYLAENTFGDKYLHQVWICSFGQMIDRGMMICATVAFILRSGGPIVSELVLGLLVSEPSKLHV